MLEKFSIIKNYNQLNLSSQREIALKAIEFGLNEIKTENILKKNLKYLKKINKFNFLAIGKHAFESAIFFEKETFNKIKKGLAYDLTQIKKKNKTRKIKILKGTHPFPTFKNIENTKKIINFLKNTKKTEKLLIIISGGGSALLSLPKNNELNKENLIIQILMKNGANIEEINTVRKHLSYARGGFLAKYLYPKKAIVFIFSDVFSNNLQFISSGPNIKDKTSLKDALKIIQKYKINKEIDFNPEELLIETPKENKYFKNIKNILISSNKIALKKIAQYLKDKKYKTKIITSKLNENNQVIAKKIALKLKSIKNKTALIYGGETTTKITGKGKGGRNQELVLKALKYIKNNELILAINSDGFDNTEFAGAIGDRITLEKTKKLNLDINFYLKNNDSFNFFKKTQDYIFTGPTHINIADIIIALKN